MEEAPAHPAPAEEVRPLPPADPGPEPPIAAAASVPADRLDREPPRYRPERPPPSARLEVTVALVISVLIVVGLATAAVIWRSEVMRLLPATVRLFRLLGPT